MDKMTIRITIAALTLIVLAIIAKKAISDNHPSKVTGAEKTKAKSIESAKIESIGKARDAEFLEEAKKNSAAADKELKAWYKTKAGRIQKKHPDWTREECENVAKGLIWIGMRYEMLVYMWGKPNSARPSNYGRGVQWQWCWTEYSPSCFYGGEDGIVTAYN